MSHLKSVLFIGVPGSGKTYLTNQLVGRDPEQYPFFMGETEVGTARNTENHQVVECYEDPNVIQFLCDPDRINPLNTLVYLFAGEYNPARVAKLIGKAAPPRKFVVVQNMVEDVDLNAESALTESVKITLQTTPWRDIDFVAFRMPRLGTAESAAFLGALQKVVLD